MRLVYLALTLAALGLVGWGVVQYVQSLPADVPEVVEEILEPGPEPEPYYTTAVIGQSVQGREIVVQKYGRGDTELLFVGGIHGGYEWNSVLLAKEMSSYFATNPRAVPEDLTIAIIPNLNPDGYALAVDENELVLDVENRLAEGRFNANGVDLNRNFDCKWAPESTWRGNVVSAGTGPFSEPEAVALRDYVLANNPAAVTFWHSQANNVYASECETGPLPETLEIMNLYATAADYGAVASFDAYPVTGDAEGWLASVGIPAITVELKSYQSTEWNQNIAGVGALMEYYDSKQ